MVLYTCRSFDADPDVLEQSPSLAKRQYKIIIIIIGNSVDKQAVMLEVYFMLEL